MFTFNPSNAQFIDSMALLLKVIGGAAAIYVFYIGFKRYQKAQTWKRREWIAKEIKDFTSSPMVRNAMYMLDWGARKIELFPAQPDYASRFVLVTRQTLNKALDLHELRPEPRLSETRFTVEETAIRDTFDHFLSEFGKFNQFIEAGLVSAVELRPYLIYWINTISKDINEPTRIVLHDYIYKYQFNDIQNFFLKFGVDITTEAKKRSIARNITDEPGCG